MALATAMTATEEWKVFEEDLHQALGLCRRSHSTEKTYMTRCGEWGPNGRKRANLYYKFHSFQVI